MSHVTDAIGHLPAQWDGHNLEGFVAAFVAEVDELRTAIEQVAREVWLPVAVGVQLDGIGTIVGLGRKLSAIIAREYFGYADQPAALGYGEGIYAGDGEVQFDDYIMNDEEYRAALHLKIAVNTGNCSVPEVVRATSELFKVPTFVTPMVDAHFVLEVPDAQTANITAILNQTELMPKAGGVKINYALYELIAFGYQDQINAGTYDTAPYVEYKAAKDDDDHGNETGL